MKKIVRGTHRQSYIALTGSGPRARPDKKGLQRNSALKAGVPPSKRERGKKLTGPARYKQIPLWGGRKSFSFWAWSEED